MLDNSEVRAHLRMGEQAVTLLNSLGYRYEQPTGGIHHWVAPESTPESSVMDAVKKLIKDETAKAYLAGEKYGMKQAAAHDVADWPNWNLVKDNVGKFFRIRQENIPETHQLRGYGPIHFMGVSFEAKQIVYSRSLFAGGYTGYLVGFMFRKSPLKDQELVWLPLSCAAFHQ